MQEQRRHQRIRFGTPPVVKIGYAGMLREGVIENLSLSGLMVRVDMPLEISHRIGCEFRVFDSPLVDVPATVVSRIGDIYGVRFQHGPINQVILEDAIEHALATGHASILAMHEAGGRKIMRIEGGLNGSLRNDFMHALTRKGVDEIDVEGVTQVESAGLALCLVAVSRHGVEIGARSPCFAAAWQQAVPSGAPL